MSTHPFFVWSDGTMVAQVIHDSLWAFPVIMALHLVGLAWLGATLLSVDLRLIGAAFRGRPVRDLARDLRPWMWGGLALTLGSGWLLFTAEALRCYENPLFWIKMMLLAAVLLFTATVRRRVLGATDAARWIERATGLTSLALWFGVALMGRGIGFW
jgi:hypothetical protein